MPGTGYAVTDDGVVERVRADYWADDFIRMVAATYPAPLAAPLPEESATVAPVVAEAPASVEPVPVTPESAAPRRRAPRKPRPSRAPGSAGSADSASEGAEVA
jgi:S-DNA-T family DNA segregation ATPase FtsK/SpoIIIE